MKRFKFYLSVDQEIIVEGENAEEARMKIINWQDEEIGQVTLLQAVDEFNIMEDVYVDEGQEIGEEKV